MQATSQALQPMQVVVSMSLHTVYSRWVSSPGMLPAWAEIFWMRSVACLMTRSLFLNLHEETLELGCVGVGVDDRGGESVGERFRCFAFVLGDTSIAPMEGDSDLVSLLAVDLHRLDALGYHGFGDVVAARTWDFD